MAISNGPIAVQPIETLQQVEVLKALRACCMVNLALVVLVNMVTKNQPMIQCLTVGFDTDGYGSTRAQLDAGGEV